MKIEIPDLTGAECGDIAITAAEGGIGYWSQIGTYDFERWSPGAGECIEVADDFVFYAVYVLDADAQDFRPVLDITPTVLRRGFEIGIEANWWQMVRLLKLAREDWMGEIDSDTADLIVQAGLFGEQVYG